MVNTNALHVAAKRPLQHEVVSRGIVIVGAFFFARVVFFEGAVPFFISLCAIVFLRYPGWKRYVLFSGLVGALTLGVGQFVIAFCQLVVLHFFNRWRFIPLAVRVFLAVGFVQCVWQAVMYAGVPPTLVQLYILSEALLAFVMTLLLSFVFVQEQRFFIEAWTSERLVAAFVVVAVLFSGLARSTVFLVNLGLVGLFVLICVMAVIGGVALATTAATVLGVIVSVSTLSFTGMMAVYAMTGVVAGSCTKLGKLGISIGMLVPSVLFFYYDATLPLDIVYFTSLFFAIVLFWCVPQRHLRQLEKRIMPNKDQVLLDRQYWLTQHLEWTVKQFERFVLFMKDVTTEHVASEPPSEVDLSVYYGKKMMAVQLQQMAEHTYRLLEQMQNHAPQFEEQEQQLLVDLQQASIPCFQVDMLEAEGGKRQVIVYCTGKVEEMMEVAEQSVSPILFEQLSQPYRLQQVEQKWRPFPHVEMKFELAKRFRLLHKVYAQKKGDVSGDVHAVFPLNEQLQALILSDGVGHDARARQQSEKVVTLLKNCLAFMNPEAAMYTLHYVMSLEQQEDLYATLDFMLIDVQSGTLWSWKAGGIATYIVRGKQVLKIEGNSPPVGFMPTMQLEMATTTLLDGDVLLMVSDGLFEGAEGFIAREKAFLKLLRQQNRQNLAIDVLLYDVIAQFKERFQMEDDCTVVACRVQHIQQEWSVVGG